MPQMTPEQARAIRAICDAIVEAVKAAGPTGAPGGVIYAALMGQGCSLETYEQFMRGLVRAGKLRKSGELYFLKTAPVSAFEQIASTLPEAAQ